MTSGFDPEQLARIRAATRKAAAEIAAEASELSARLWADIARIKDTRLKAAAIRAMRGEP